MAEHPDLRIEQANTAIHDYIRALPDGRITADARPGYARLIDAYMDAVKAHEDDEARPAAA